MMSLSTCRLTLEAVASTFQGPGPIVHQVMWETVRAEDESTKVLLLCVHQPMKQNETV